MIHTVAIFLAIIGAVMGSFLCCQARRLHRRARGQKPLGRWSVCEHCSRRLRWYDNLPVISWLLLRGRCRHCRSKIGAAEFLSELSGLGLGLILAFTSPLATASTASTPAYWPWLIWAFQAILGFLLLFLAIYDGLYGEIPLKLLTFSLICATLVVILRQWSFISVATSITFNTWLPLLNSLGAAAVLGGIYLLLYLISRGRWVGDGDWLLATAIGLSLGTPWLALCALFAANFSACIIMGPAAVKRQKSQIHFGPFLVLAWAIILAFSAPLASLIA